MTAFWKGGTLERSVTNSPFGSFAAPQSGPLPGLLSVGN
jgi:hypothetical protein